MGTVIAFGGKKQSGKDTAASFLIKQFGFKSIAYADKMKKAVAKLYGWDLDSLYDPIKKEETLPKAVIWGIVEAVLLEDILGLPEYSLGDSGTMFPSRRVAMQYIGTEVLRAYDKNFHVNSVIEEVKANPNNNYVISDCRFPNELNVVRELHGTTVYIDRGQLEGKHQDHASEQSVSKSMFDITICNMGTKHEFEQQIVHLAQSLLTIEPS